MLSSEVIVVKMFLDFVDATLDEQLVWVAVVLVFHLEVGLRLELLADALAIGDDVVDAQLQVFELERLGEIGIGTRFVTLDRKSVV